FFTSPDQLQTVAAGRMTGKTIDEVESSLLDTFRSRYGTVALISKHNPDPQRKVTEITFVVQKGDQVFDGDLILQVRGSDILVVWQAAPPNWSAALSTAVTVPIFQAIQ